ncbi:penicillin-binding protein 1C [Variovorax paradoxus]|jgi:penicillin-binding protein 1C|uniref:penicillin-binding protein 1C n=1 Tax=Variovorax paradoxus TaxID=34073 RepID=UPI0006E63ECF|nr:penicillin-binding protein 1C [Variovorax paradoxus]KPV04307.1 penicillin-binding protein 1C [Variovorax paradoxus]KPV04353.1 penicillin-binding protein 1C [Variovorax paradoxus]KPV20187.1 penicillin-binding protein 1C [Variovorax paradoxus]KPV30588.1 penicillin-binding protein 1C [Variovorax paradoxus]
MTRTLARRALIAGVLLALLLALLRLWPHAPLSETVGSSRAVYARGGELLRLTLAADEQYRLWVPLDRISPTLIDAVLLYEDRRFYAHPGVNPAALVRSAWRIASGERRQGGSTLTMQLARRLYGIDSRTAGGKVAQIAAALWIEARHGKREILEAYLNTAPYGGNIEGVQAASLIYFRKDAARLSLPEALTLAVIPQNPVKRIAERGRNTELQAARERLWALWAERDPAARQHAPDAQLVLSAQSRGSLPFLAPHLTDMLLAQPRSDAGVAAPVEIRATLDLRMQSTLERVMAQYLRTHADVGMNNASALLLDASTMQVRALIGSADWHDDAIAGQVNGTQAKRSPGSTLKPFIYALALDQGLLHPKTMLKDAPTAFGPYTPENFDHRFAGPLSAQEALIRSRNVPAVAVAAKLSKPGLYDFMRLAGVQKLQSESHYGLALVLGGGEVTPEELAGLYGTLANGGIAQPLRYTEPAPDERPAQPLRLLSEEASFITLDMLRQTPRPDTTLPARPAIAWKTGTSWGFRDAWTAGVFGRHVLVVWVGNFDGSSNPALVGVDAAAPLFLRMVDALRAERLDPGEVAVTQPANLRQVEVCAATGGLPDALCPVRTRTWFIAGKSPIQVSNLHRAVWVDETTGKVVCGPQPNARQQVVEQWGSDMRRLFRQAGLPRASVPADGCEQKDAGAPEAAPLISSPLRGVRHTLRVARPEPLVLRAEAAAGTQTLYWFADDALVGRAAPGEGIAWMPDLAESGRRYVLRVVDDQGRAESREVIVDIAP